MIKKRSKVKILTGKDKNKDGEVIEIDRANNRAKVKGINMVKKHVKTTKEKKGGIIFFSIGCWYFLSTKTVIVLFGISLTTIPFNNFLVILFLIKVSF